MNRSPLAFRTDLPMAPTFRALISRKSLRRLAVFYAVAVTGACPAVLSAAEGDMPSSSGDIQPGVPTAQTAPPQERPSAEPPATAESPTATPPQPPAPTRAGEPNPTASDARPAAREATPPIPIPVAAGVEARAAASGTVAMEDFRFSPGSVTVDAGDTVTWTNSGKEPHTATGDGFDTGLIKSRERGSASFARAGNFSYLCSIHPEMRGTVRVVAAQSGGSEADSPPAGGEPGGERKSSSESADVPGRESASDAAAPKLPTTGSEAGRLGMIGVALLALGTVLRRRLANCGQTANEPLALRQQANKGP